MRGTQQERAYRCKSVHHSHWNGMFLQRLGRWLSGNRSNVPGVVYSDEMRLDELISLKEAKWDGVLRNVRMETAPAILTQGNALNEEKPGPEKEPYSFWERVGIVPVHPSRVRQRQYYLPITDFALYDYDEASPEERDLTARWMARVMQFNGYVPAGVLAVGACIALPFPTPIRMPLLIATGLSGVALELTRSYLRAAEERQDLDDFIMAKEIWYIKNVETYQLGIPRMPRGREKEYHAYLDSSQTVMQEPLPPELLDALHY